MNKIQQIIDPHCHFWDTIEHPNDLLPHVDPPIYLLQDYLREFDELRDEFDLLESVYVETLHYADSSPDVQWVLHLRSPPLPQVASFDLSQPDPEIASQQLQEILRVGQGSIRGVRYILNHHPAFPALTWPNSPHPGLLLSDPSSSPFAQNFRLLASHGLSFDLQANPHQLPAAAEFLSHFPDTPVCVDHLGCLRLGWGPDPPDLALSQWQTGMAMLAKLPRVYVKLSMLWFCREDYGSPEGFAALSTHVNFVIDLFGASRCMFASNYPVDRRPKGPSLRTLYQTFYRLVAQRSLIEIEALFKDTAIQFYRLKFSLN